MLSAIPVPVHDSFGPKAALYILIHSECKAIIVNGAKYESFLYLKPDAPLISHVILIAEPKDDATNFNDVLNTYPSLKYDEPSPEDMSIIMCTSGSTGNPKECVLLYSNLIADSAGFSCLGTSCTTSDIFISFLPLAISMK